MIKNTYMCSMLTEHDNKKAVLIKIEHELEDGTTRTEREFYLDYDSIELDNKPVNEKNIEFFIQGKQIEG